MWLVGITSGDVSWSEIRTSTCTYIPAGGISGCSDLLQLWLGCTTLEVLG